MQVNIESKIESFLKDMENIFPEPRLAASVESLEIFLGRLKKMLDENHKLIKEDTWQNNESFQRIFERVIKAMQKRFDEFEAAASKIEESLAVKHKDFVRERLHKLLMGSPFLNRCFYKPLGYPGDYYMLEMMTGCPFKGEKPYDKIINFYFLKQPASLERNSRIKILTKKLKQVSEKGDKNRKVKIMSVGCGPALEIRSFIKSERSSQYCDFTLADFDKETIRYTKEKIEKAKEKSKRYPSVTFIENSAVNMLKDDPPPIKWNFIYCTGLFDYFKEDLCISLVQAFYRWLSADGVLLVSNFNINNPNMYVMDYLADWRLKYRDKKQLEKLGAGLGHSKIFTDKDNINLYLEIQKV